MIWTDQQWSMCRYDTAAMRELLADRGFTVTGFTNRKPVIEGDVNWEEIQDIAAGLAPGGQREEAMPAPPALSPPKRRRSRARRK